jgi:hypothetical protein
MFCFSYKDDGWFQLLSSLMPRAIIRQLKRGQIPKPEIFDNTTVFFSDIVSFTQVFLLTCESVAKFIVPE